MKTKTLRRVYLREATVMLAMARLAVRRMVRSRQEWREEERSAPAAQEAGAGHATGAVRD